MHTEQAVRRPPLETAQHTRVAELMSTDVVTVRPDLSIESLVEIFLERGLSRVPVVDDEGRPIGVVAKTDVVTDSHFRGDTTEEGRPELQRSPNVRYTPEGFHTHVTGALVGDVMTPTIVSLPESASVAHAAELMATQHLHGVPITSSSGRLIGLLSALDVVGWVAGL